MIFPTLYLFHLGKPTGRKLDLDEDEPNKYPHSEPEDETADETEADDTDAEQVPQKPAVAKSKGKSHF